MMETGKPRRWFQLHLSTCVAMMLIAAGLLWLNVRPITNPMWEGAELDFLTGYGWPLIHYYVPNGNLTLVDLAFAGIEHDPSSRVLWFRALVNGIVFLLSVIAVAGIFELLLGRFCNPIVNRQL
ncbi:MAG: hypothetical protein HY291_05345 [Planctomycetes bacterium]|nr:hypothetical protein [Planctomycetota bacterium]